MGCSNNYKNIRKNLVKIHLCSFLESMCSSKQASIDPCVLEELMILATQPDIFQRNIRGEMDHYLLVSNNDYWQTLQKLHLIITFKHKRSGDHYYEFCKLTPLGKDFVTKNTALERTSRTLLKMHHKRIIKDILIVPIIFLSMLCAFSSLLLLLIGTNGFTTHFYISSKMVSWFISPATIVAFALIITGIIIYVAISCSTKPAVTRNDQSLDDQYDDLCRFVSEPFVKQAVAHDAPLITMCAFLNFIADHLDSYSQIVDPVYSLRSLRPLLTDHLFRPQK